MHPEAASSRHRSGLRLLRIHVAPPTDRNPSLQQHKRERLQTGRRRRFIDNESVATGFCNESISIRSAKSSLGEACIAPDIVEANIAERALLPEQHVPRSAVLMAIGPEPMHRIHRIEDRQVLIELETGVSRRAELGHPNIPFPRAIPKDDAPLRSQERSLQIGLIPLAGDNVNTHKSGRSPSSSVT